MPLVCLSSTKLKNPNLLVSACIVISPNLWLVLRAILWIFLLLLHNLRVRVIMVACTSQDEGIPSISAWHNDTFILFSFLTHKSCIFWLSPSSEVILFKKLCWKRIRFFLYSSYHIMMLSYFLTCFFCIYLHQILSAVLLPISWRICFATWD